MSGVLGNSQRRKQENKVFRLKFLRVCSASGNTLDEARHDSCRYSDE